jgi:hypothetical protein
MNPIRAYFKWHDSKYIARTQDPRKNQFDLQWLIVLRPLLLVTTGIGWLFIVLMLLFPSLFPDYALALTVILFSYSVFSYSWVTEAFLFRRYIEDHRGL